MSRPKPEFHLQRVNADGTAPQLVVHLSLLDTCRRDVRPDLTEWAFVAGAAASIDLALSAAAGPACETQSRTLCQPSGDRFDSASPPVTSNRLRRADKGDLLSRFTLSRVGRAWRLLPTASSWCQGPRTRR